MQRINRSLGLGIGLLVMCAGVAGCSSKAKDWTFKDSQGSIRNMSAYQGKVLVLGFSNSWCEPCQDAAVHMQVLQNRFADQPVKIMNISSWEHGNAEAFMREHGYTFDLMVNGTEVAREWDVDQIPTFVVVGVDGKVLSRHEGFSQGTPDKIASSVEKHLQKVARNPGRYKTYAQHGG
jgi:peroxiredoxin